MRFWEFEWDGIMSTVGQSLWIGLIAASVALLLALVAHEYRIKYKWQVPGFIIAIPMLIPQLSVLFGMQVTTLYITAAPMSSGWFGHTYSSPFHLYTCL